MLFGLTLPLASAPGFTNVRDHGAIPDGAANNTAAFERAVAACAALGGGTICVPAGRYLTGSIRLESNQTLWLEAGAELLYSGDPADSPIVPSRWEGTRVHGRAPLVYAYERENVSIVGRGRLNGQGSNWWWRNGVHDPLRAQSALAAIHAWKSLYAQIEAGEPVGPGAFLAASDFLRPSLVQFNGCRNVLVEGVTLTESPMWMLHPVFCENVVVRGVTLISTGPNGDGISVDSSRDVRISDCFFDTGDDCVVIKSGRDADGRRTARPTENVAIANCVMHRGHGAVVVGSETAGGIRNVVASNIVSRGTDRGIRIKSMRGRGGVVENLRFENFVIEDALKEALEINALYQPTAEEPVSERTPAFRNISLSNLTIVNAERVARIEGLPEQPITGLRLANITATGRTGVHCEHVADLDIRDVHVDPASGPAFDYRHIGVLRPAAT